MKSMSFVIVSLLMALSVQVGVCQRWDKKTKVKFNVPVQVPNADLPAGTYVFKPHRSVRETWRSTRFV
jgi:hypothetical protein